MKRTSDVQLKFTTSEMIEKIYRIVMKDHRIKMRDITEIVGISVDRMHNILHKELEMKKFCAWVPRLLTKIRNGKIA